MYVATICHHWLYSYAVPFVPVTSSFYNWKPIRPTPLQMVSLKLVLLNSNVLEQVRSNVEMGNRSLKDFSQASRPRRSHPGILCLGEKPFLALMTSFSFTYYGIKHTLWWWAISPSWLQPSCSKYHGFLIFIYPLDSSIAVKIYQMSIITFVLSNHKFLIDRKCTLMTLHRHNIAVVKKDELFIYWSLFS